MGAIVEFGPVAYRSGLVAADVLALPGTVTCTKLTGVGALTANPYYIKVVAVNANGRTTGKAGNATVTTETTNLGVRAAFAAVTGATAYDLYCSTAADPLWVGRVTAAQRASGIVINAVGSTAAGGTANAVDIYAVGTGLAALVSAATNTAWAIPAAVVNCAGRQYADFDLICSRSGDAVAPALTVSPWLYNSRLAVYVRGQVQTLTLDSMAQRVRVEVRGNPSVALLVQSIAGTGMSVAIDVTLS